MLFFLFSLHTEELAAGIRKLGIGVNLDMLAFG